MDLIFGVTLCDWIYRLADLSDNISFTLTFKTCALMVVWSVPYSMYIHNYVAKYKPNSIFEYTNDTTARSTIGKN